MTLPNFLIIGAAKSGTTSLYRYLEQHPEIYVNAKEPSFFALEGQDVQYAGPGDEEGFITRAVTKLEDYEKIFVGVQNELAYGEASVLYLYSPIAPQKIKKHVPHVKLIAILRNPVDRAYSSYLHLRRDGREPVTDFMEALKLEDERVAANWEHQWHYRRLGCYYSQLKRYYDLFPKEQILIFSYDEYIQEPVRVMQEIFSFLGVDSTFEPDVSVKHNVSGTPRVQSLHTFVRRPNMVKSWIRPFIPVEKRRGIAARIKKWNIDTQKEEISPEARKYLTEFYVNEINDLSAITSKNFAYWLT